jgi:hypothetical protein
MPGIRCCLEPALLLASEPEFLSQALDSVHSNNDTMIGQVPLQSLGATGLTLPRFHVQQVMQP